MVHAPEPAVRRDFPDDGFEYPLIGPIPDDRAAQADQQLDDFVGMLVKRGIRVARPVSLDFSQAVATPEWQPESMFGCMPPRDVLTTVGPEILEATMS